MRSSETMLMWHRRGEGQRMKPQGTKALKGYTCKDFPLRTKQN